MKPGRPGITKFTSLRTFRWRSSACWMAAKAWSAAGPFFGSAASFFRKASSAATFWAKKSRSTSASRSPFRALSEFSTPKRRLFETRFCSAPRFWNSVTAPRSSERRMRVAGQLHVALVLELGHGELPVGPARVAGDEDQRRPPSGRPAFQARKSLVWSGLPSS